ncbi:Ig-like domain-containing protein, partial [Pseudomonas fragi]
PITGNLSDGGVSNDTTPTLHGQATPGATVTVYDGTTPLGTTTADGLGNWSYTTPDLGEGSHSFTATATTATGGSAPTAAFNLTIDTTAPGQPGAGGNGGIDLITDDVGLVTGPIANGGTTDDTTPTLSGGGQEPGATVTIIDNGQPLGTAIVGPDGTWSYTPPPLNEGAHPFTLIVTDPAGNASLPSDPYTIIVDTTPPLASAIVDGMSKDSGTNHNNFITNDGSAGRVIEGSLTSALAVGEKVQVSSDGGVTWLDATVTGTKWSALDLSSHNANWEIQTRVIDLAGNTNVSSQSVILDTTVQSPTSVSWDGFNIAVNFNPASVAVGDKVHLIIDGNAVEHTLTASDIAAGKVELLWESTVHGNSNSIDAAIVDSTGNISSYLPYTKITTTVTAETFNSQSQSPLTTGQMYSMNGFELTAVATTSGTSGSTGFGTTLGVWAEPPTTMALIMTGGSNIKLTMDPNQTFDAISFRVGDFNYGDSLVANFYDAGGNLVYTTTTPGQSNLSFVVTQELPLGLVFSSVSLISGGSAVNAFWIDDIQLGTTNYTQGAPHDPLTDQTITQSGEYYGAETDNTFFIDSVALLDPAGSGIHGGGGIDTLKLTGQNQVLDLTNLGQKVESIEVIDLTGTGNNTLKLSLTDVLEQGGTSLFTNDGHIQMMVKGNAGDAVILDDLLANGTDPGNWANSGQVSVSGVVYEVYRHDTLDAELLVQQGVTTTLV